METVKDLADHLAARGLSPEKFAAEIKISNMTVRRLLRKAPETALPEKYKVLIAARSRSKAATKPVRAASPWALGLQAGAVAGALPSFDSLVNDLQSSGETAATDQRSMAALERDVDDKLQDKAIDLTLRDRVRRVRAMIRAGRLSLRDKAILAGALLYLVNPVDLIPDAIPVVGYLDDLAVLTLASDVVVRNVKKRMNEEAAGKNELLAGMA